MADRPQQSAHVRINPSDSGLLLVRGPDVYELSGVAAYIWKHCDGESAVERIAELVSEEYEVTAQEALEDVKGFVNELRRAYLIDAREA